MRIKYSYILAVAVAALSACSDGKPEGVAQPAGEVNRIGYSFTKGGVDAPADQSTYTFVSYKQNADLSYGPNPPVNSAASGDESFHVRGWGTYAYLADAKYQEIFQPCDVNATTFAYVARNAQKGQGLLNGIYKTVCLKPGRPIVGDGRGSERVPYPITDEVLASDPFDMEVKGYEIFELNTSPDVDGDYKLPLYETRTKMYFEIVQGTTNTFSITSMSLVNAGYWGWYHPLLQNTVISYDPSVNHLPPSSNFKGEGMYNIYDKINNITPGSVDPMVISPNPGAGDGDIYYTGNSGLGNTVYTTGTAPDDGIILFSSDYSIDEMLQPAIIFEIDMNGGTFEVLIPFNYHLKRNTRYRFRLTVESVVVRAEFRETQWLDGYGNTLPMEDIGDGQPWTPFGTWTIKGWIPVDNGTYDIGE